MIYLTHIVLVYDTFCPHKSFVPRGYTKISEVKRSVEHKLCKNYTFGHCGATRSKSEN